MRKILTLLITLMLGWSTVANGACKCRSDNFNNWEFKSDADGDYVICEFEGLTTTKLGFRLNGSPLQEVWIYHILKHENLTVSWDSFWDVSKYGTAIPGCLPIIAIFYDINGVPVDGGGVIRDCP